MRAGFGITAAAGVSGRAGAGGEEGDEASAVPWAVRRLRCVASAVLPAALRFAVRSASLDS